MQTQIQKDAAIRMGSIVLEVGPTLGSLVNVGALRDISFNQKGESAAIKFDNAQEIKTFRNGSKFSLDATLAEINWSNIAIMNDGQVVVTPVAGVSTPVVNEAKGTGWVQGTPFRLNNKNGANTVVTGIVIKENGVTLVLNTDYRVYVGNGTNGELGYTYIVPLSARTLAITADYAYVPSASKVVTFNENGKMVEKFIRITNTNEAGQTKVYVLSGVTNVAPIEIDFAGDEENEVATLPISLEGYVVSITDAQQTT